MSMERPAEDIQKEAQEAFAQFLPQVQEFAKKDVVEINQQEINGLIESSQKIELIRQNQIIFNTLVDLRRALFRPDDKPKESTEDLLKKLRETVA